MVRGKRQPAYLFICELQNLQRLSFDLLIDGVNQKLNSSLHSINPLFQRPQILSGVPIDTRKMSHRLLSDIMEKSKVSESLLPVIMHGQKIRQLSQ